MMPNITNPYAHSKASARFLRKDPLVLGCPLANYKSIY